MTDHALETPDHLEPDVTPIPWRRQFLRWGGLVLMVFVFLVLLELAGSLFDDDDPPPVIEQVLGTAVQCTRTSSEPSLVGGSPSPAPSQTQIWPGSCEDLGFYGDGEPVVHADGKRYLDTYTTEYHVRVWQFELEDGRGEYTLEDGSQALMLVDQACYERYRELGERPGLWTGCDEDAESP